MFSPMFSNRHLFSDIFLTIPCLPGLFFCFFFPTNRINCLICCALVILLNDLAGTKVAISRCTWAEFIYWPCDCRGKHSYSSTAATHILSSGTGTVPLYSPVCSRRPHSSLPTTALQAYWSPLSGSEEGQSPTYSPHLAEGHPRPSSLLANVTYESFLLGLSSSSNVNRAWLSSRPFHRARPDSWHLLLVLDVTIKISVLTSYYSNLGLSFI